MPLPPPAVPAATVDGRLTAGGGRADDSTRATGAAWAGTEPVTSLEELLYGLSLKRVVSELQPAAPMAITTNAAARGHDRERNDATTEDMVELTHTQQTRSRVNTLAVNKALSDYDRSTLTRRERALAASCPGLTRQCVARHKTSCKRDGCAGQARA
jgi:hypothetical protein